eukprot:GAFH01001483.1.p2 GENE.GAFH01001483.1~~GAFH01001483.1.p2  ORF type:complete len:512 (-),score=112.45 GAFH01001483.1:67-1416(-)
MFAASGIHAIYLMGVWSLGPFGLHRDQTDPDLIRGYAQVLPGYTTDDIIGSPFAITHFSCNSQLGSDADIGHLRDRLHARGIALILDFVPNHTAVDADWMSSNPDYYVHAAPGVSPPYDPNRYMPSGIAYGRDPYSGAWPDTAQLNYWNPDLRTAQVNNLLKIATLADGVRCDMAMLELNSIFAQTWGGELRPSKYPAPTSEFWRDAIRAVKAKNPTFVFLAETYWDGTVEALHACGFDFLYDKDGLYNQLQSGYLDNLRGYIANMNFTYMAHFVENHDEVRAIAGFGSPARADAAAAVAITLPGMRFYFDGQWEGKKNKLDVHLRRSADEAVNVPVQQFYSKLLNITDAPVFHSGAWRYLTCSDFDGTSWRLMAWSWSMGSEKRLVVVNYSDTKGIARVRIPDVAGSGNVVIHELFSDETYTRSASEMRDSGLVVVLEAWQTQIFSYP